MIRFETGKSATDITLLCGAAHPPKGEGSFEQLLQVALDGLIDIYVARRGQLKVLPAERHGGINLVRSHFRTFLPERDLLHSRDSILRSMSSGAPVFRDNQAVENAGFYSSLCVPIPGERGPSGWIYLERPGRGSAFDRDQLWQAQWLAQLVSVELNNGLRRNWSWRFLDVSRVSRHQVA